jgi:hypothetical protein
LLLSLLLITFLLVLLFLDLRSFKTRCYTTLTPLTIDCPIQQLAPLPLFDSPASLSPSLSNGPNISQTSQGEHRRPQGEPLATIALGGNEPSS